MKYYIQSDSRWGSKPYAGENIATAGCGATAVACIVDQLPNVVADYITSVGGASNGSGTYWEGIKAACDHFGYSCTQMNSSSLYGVAGSAVEQQWLKAMRSGDYYGILLFGKGYYCNGGHYNVVESVDANNNVKVWDVAFQPRSGTHNWNATVPAGAPGACNVGCPYFYGRVKIFYLIKKKATVKTTTSLKIIDLPDVVGGNKNKYALLGQRILRVRGYKGADGKSLALDKEWGNNCIYACKKFQKENKIPQTGKLDKTTWTQLLGITPNGKSRTLQNIKSGAKNQFVLLAQELLRIRGYKGADGKALALDQSWGKNVTYAWKAFVKDYKASNNKTLSKTTISINEWTALLGF